MPEMTIGKLQPLVAEIVEQHFSGRRGHGGGPCRRRVLGRIALGDIIAKAYILGYQAAKREGKAR